MWLSAVSFGVVLTGLAGQGLSGAESAAWTRVQKLFVTISDASGVRGSAVAIDPRHFIAHQNVVGAPPIRGTAQDGSILMLVVLATDAPTQMVLLRSDKALSGAPMFALASPTGNTRLLVAVPGGPIRAELVAGDRLGVMNSSQRMFPLTEIRFESASSWLAGAPAFNLRGELVGILGATLDAPQADMAANGDFAPRRESSKALGVARNFGPSALTVGYSLNTTVMRRVVEGFMSPSRQVRHPMLGILCRDATGGGVIVEAVQAGSTAAEAGMKIGDVILAIQNTTIRDKSDYGRIMARQDVGNRLEAKIRRGNAERMLQVRVGT